MFQSDLYVSERVMHSRLRERRQRLENRHLRKRAAGLSQGWLSRQACRLLGGLGVQLVALGERLKGYDGSRTLPLEEAGGSR